MSQVVKTYTGKPTTMQTDTIVLHMVVMGGGSITSLIWAIQGQPQLTGIQTANAHSLCRKIPAT